MTLSESILSDSRVVVLLGVLSLMNLTMNESLSHSNPVTPRCFSMMNELDRLVGGKPQPYEAILIKLSRTIISSYLLSTV
jgi:hypothetical protein